MEYVTSQGDTHGDGDEDSNCDFFDEDERGDDLLNISAHSSGSDDSSDHRCPDDHQGSVAPVESTACTAVSDRTNDEVVAATATEERDLEEDDPSENESEKLVRLVGEAQFLFSRFQRYVSLHPQLPGLSKLKTRFEREVELGEAALLMEKQKLGTKLSRDDEGQLLSHQSSAPAACNTKPPSRPPYAKCNCVPLLELTMHVLENEPNVVGVMHPINPATLRKTLFGLGKDSGHAKRGQGDALGEQRVGSVAGIQFPTAAFEVDVVSCSGKRWVKIKGTSRRNLELELSASADRRPFSSVLENLVKGAALCRLPFGVIPQIDVLFYFRPSQEIVDECVNVVDRATACGSTEQGEQQQPSASFRVGGVGLGRRPQLNVHVFERAIKKYIATASTLSSAHGPATSNSSSPRRSAASWHDVPLRTRFDAMSSIWAPFFLAPIHVHVACINFDVTALVALCSDTCNGFAGRTIPNHKILDEQSRDEQTDPAVVGHIEGCLRQHSQPTATVEEMKSVIGAHVLAAGGDPSKLLVAPARGCALNAQQCLKLLLLEDAPVGPDGFVCASTDGGRVLDDSDLQFASTTLKQLLCDAKRSSDGQNGASWQPRRMNWIVSDVALSEFLWIISTIAGPAEYRRAVVLLRHMYVVGSDAIQSALMAAASVGGAAGGGRIASLDAVMCLESTGKISDRHKAVFGLGNAAHAITLSANKQFAQAARDQGVEVCVEHHPARALTERKRQGEDRMDGPRRPPLPNSV